MNLEELNCCLVDAIESKSLRETLSELVAKGEILTPDARIELDRTIAAIETIDRDLEREISRVEAICHAAGISVKSIEVAYPNNVLHCLKVSIDQNQLPLLAEILSQEGFKIDDEASCINLQNYAKFYERLTFWSSQRLQFRVLAVWNLDKIAKSKVVRALRPSLGDLRLAIPTYAWPIFLVSTLFRKLLRRSKSTGVQMLGPFLGTPNGMVHPLLQFSGLQSDHQFIDIGCGDGRILLTAAKDFGCQAIGYETDKSLVGIAQQNANHSKLQDLVTLKATDANEADVSSADVVFVFLPASQISKLVSDLLPKMKPQAVLIAHEQDKLEVSRVPDKKQPLILECGVSVASKWIAAGQ